MMLNHYDHEYLAQAHRQDLLREAEYERLLAQLPDPDRSQLSLPARLVLFLRELRAVLQRANGLSVRF
ncbi:MAG: hypothetical protein M3Z24_12485 [Chloroflexota bacterium]|nr:hypothetical protein [Chloroflexota bacterium]